MGIFTGIAWLFFKALAASEIYTLSLHDALPIFRGDAARELRRQRSQSLDQRRIEGHHRDGRSEEHTSELQSPDHLVCRLLLEKKKLQEGVHDVMIGEIDELTQLASHHLALLDGR